jgi:hypothetical protein
MSFAPIPRTVILRAAEESNAVIARGNRTGFFAKPQNDNAGIEFSHSFGRSGTASCIEQIFPPLPSKATKGVLIALSLVIAAYAAEPAPYEWQPGSVFRDYTFNGDAKDDGVKHRPHISEVDPGTKRANLVDRLPTTRAPRLLNVSIAGAQRAEFIPEYWGGHIGTQAWFQVNKTPWIPWPRPVGTVEPPEHYYHSVLGNRAVPLRVQDLLEGENTFRITAGPQTYSSFDWGFFWIYAFTVRVYHPRAAAHPSGIIANITAGGSLGENPAIVVKPTPGAAPINRVDVFAFYDDFNWSGSGFHREWHAQMIFGVPHHHVGSATSAPWTVRWNTEWVPDQSQPVRLVARVIDEAGWQTVTPIVENVKFTRAGRSVKMIRASELPKQFGVRAGRELSCALNVPELSAAPTRARIMLLSWSGSHVERIRLNDTPLSPKIGRVHEFAVDAIEVPPAAVKPGKNVFAMFSDTREHAAEVDWPGPVLLLEFAGK